MRVFASVLNWLGKWYNRLTWARHYFIFPPNEADPEEMAEYHRRLSN